MKKLITISLLLLSGVLMSNTSVQRVESTSEVCWCGEWEAENPEDPNSRWTRSCYALSGYYFNEYKDCAYCPDPPSICE